MEYTAEMQSTLDIDWFAIDANDVLIHFASGGGPLPLSISAHKEDTVKLSRYFRECPFNNQVIHINQKLSDFVFLKSEQAKERYLSDFLSMSKRGIYSFDKTNPGNFAYRRFHLVSFPEASLQINVLSQDIVKILKRTRIDVDITKVMSLSISEDGLAIYPI